MMMRKRKLRRINRIMGLTDVQLGRKTRRYFRRSAKTPHSSLIITAASIIGIVGSIFFKEKFIETNNLWLYSLALCSLFMPMVLFGVIMIVYQNLLDTPLGNHGLIGGIMNLFGSWKCQHRGRMDFSDFIRHSFDNGPDKQVYFDIDNWTNEELGRFMRIVTSATAIYVNADGEPNETVLRNFIRDAHVEDTMNEIKTRILKRHTRKMQAEQARQFEEARAEIAAEEQERLRRRKEHKAASEDMADTMKTMMVQEEPDKDNPDYIRLVNLKNRLDDSADELRTIALMSESSGK